MLNQPLTKISAVLLLITINIACSNADNDLIDENLSLDQQIDRLIENNHYETALSMLEDYDRENPEIRLLLEKTHLNFGLHSMNTFDMSEMRTRMNNALTQFTEVLKLNPNNVVAREQIEQILMIYSTIPNRDPDPDVLEGLREIGFDY
jgi:hypothetical protein